MIKRRRRKNKKVEQSVHKTVVDYIKLRYPNIIFRSDAGGIRLTMGQAVQFKKLQSGRAYPDLFIAEPRGKYHGLYIEIKKNDDEYLKKDGTIRQNEHILEQFAMLLKLEKNGYAAVFGGGFTNCETIIDDYMSLPINYF